MADIPHDDSRNALSAAVMLWPKHTFPITATEVFSKFVLDHVVGLDRYFLSFPSFLVLQIQYN